MSNIGVLVKFLALILFSFAGCSSADVRDNILNEDINTDRPADSANILIVYLSRTSNTKAVAGIIQDVVGGKLVALELENPYPENYRSTVDQVARENESGFLPPLKTKIPDLQKFDLIFIGFPTWGMQLPPPIKSFLRANNLGGKTVIPFNTNAGYGVGSSFETVSALCTNCKILEGFTTTGGVERDGVLLAIKEERARQTKEEVRQWLRKIGLLR